MESEIINIFLAYYLTSITDLLIALSSGATFLEITKATLLNVEIPLPPLPTQRKIAAVLSAYDDLIENNTRRIKILEDMAQTIYREWFVHFRFPGHQQVKMVESEFGLIPEGWEVKQLGEFIDIKHGYAFKGQYFAKEPTKDILLTPGNFAIGGGFKSDKLKHYDGPVPEDFVLDEGDLIITMTDLSKIGDTLGYPALVPPLHELRFLHNQRLGKVISNDENSLGRMLLYYIFCSDAYRHRVLATATGATVKHSAPDRIKAHKIVLPPKRLRERFEKVVGAFREKIVVIYEQSRILRQTRDLLLPKLISGEIDVSELDIDTEVYTDESE